MSHPAPLIIRKVKAFTTYLSEGFLGGPRVIKLAWVVNLQKGGTLPFVLALMFAYGNFSPAAWAYLGLHGSYGLIWLLKDAAFPDPQFEKRVTIGGALNAVLLVLGPYWVAPVLLITDVLPRRPAGVALIGVCIVVYAVGVVIMMVSDAQKYFTLQIQRGLITTGMFARVRHPNYLGEMMVYGSFAGLVGHWIPWAVLAWVWLLVFLPNILTKEASMSRYPEWNDYVARTGLILPRLFR